jgi:hypothetical protein
MSPQLGARNNEERERLGTLNVKRLEISKSEYRVSLPRIIL